MKRYLLPFLVVAGLLSTTTGALAQRQVRLMSYNVGAFGKELDDSAPMIARMIAELGAETVSLNELDSCNRRHNIDQVQHLAEELNAVEKAGGGKARWQGRFVRAMGFAGGAYGNGIVTDKRILNQYGIALPQGKGSEPRVCVVVETRGYVFASCHLDYLDEAARCEQARVLTEELKRRYGSGRKPVFLAGDFNDVPGSALLKQLSRDWTILSPLDDSYSALEPHECIDYIFVLHGGRPVTVVDGAVARDFTSGDVGTASDHLPVWVEVRF